MGEEKHDSLSIEKYREQLDIWYKGNNIIREKSELYYDFISSLINLIDETYLGSDIISTQEDMINHFMWCFQKVASNFEKERISFTPVSATAYDYLWYFIYKGYYTSNVEGRRQILLDYFKFLFDHNSIKTPSEMESYLDFYKIFDQNLKKLN
jgi:hypothetical protein